MLQHQDKDITDKPRYSIRNLVTNKEYVVDVTHIRPFYYDPAYVTPLNIAVKDTDETVVEMIVNHDFSNPQDKKWLVRWLTDPPSETWEQYENLKNVEAFQHYCATNRLDPFTPKLPPQFSASVPGGQRQDSSLSRPLNRRRYQRHVQLQTLTYRHNAHGADQRNRSTANDKPEDA